VMVDRFREPYEVETGRHNPTVGLRIEGRYIPLRPVYSPVEREKALATAHLAERNRVRAAIVAAWGRR